MIPRNSLLRCVAAGVDRVFVEHPIFERAARDIYGANYTYVDSDAGIPDLDLRWSILSQAALAAPVVLWPPSQQHDAAAAHGLALEAGTAADSELPPTEWAEIAAAAHDAAEQARAERAVQQERLAREAESRAKRAAEVAASEAASDVLSVQLGRSGSAVSAAEPQAGTVSGGDARPFNAVSQTSVTEAHLVSAAQQQALSEASTTGPVAPAAEHSQAAAVGEQSRLAGTSRLAATSAGPFEHGVIFVGTAPLQCSSAASALLRMLPLDKTLRPAVGLCSDGNVLMRRQ